MNRFLLLILFLGASACGYGQIRMDKLVIARGQTYEIRDSSILVADTIMMEDSSRIVLNKRVAENFIHSKIFSFGRGCMIDGKGLHGLQGINGRTGLSSTSPCSNGAEGIRGTAGTNGSHGTSLSLYFLEMRMKGNLAIDISGGDAGDGGAGGGGGGGGAGTRLCTGGNGGNGSAGSNGGSGGNSGNLNFHTPLIIHIRSELGGKLSVRNYGGNLGVGGEGGSGGYAGLSPNGKSALDGKHGRKGLKGKDGKRGRSGQINFSER